MSRDISNSGDDPVTVGDAVVAFRTNRATRFSLRSLDDDVDPAAVEDSDAFWVPNACVHDDSECHGAPGTEGALVVKRWWAAMQGLVE